MDIFLLLSGPVAVGKSWLANELIARQNFKSIRTGAYLVESARAQSLAINRTNLQQVGDALDLQTDYRWVLDSVADPAVNADTRNRLWLLDSVRKERQVEHFSTQYGASIFHVHLRAPEDVLEWRYEARRASGADYSSDTPYGIAILHPNEVAARGLEAIADLVVDVSKVALSETVAAIVTRHKGQLPCAD
jgi:adenylosuccinate synthase